MRRLLAGQRGRLRDHAQDREECDALSVGEAAALHDRRLVGAATDELLDESRLSDARGSEHGDQSAGVIAYDSVEGLGEKLELAVASDDRRCEPAASHFRHREQANRRDGLAFALEGQWLDGLGRDRIPHEAVRALPDQYFPRLRRLLEPRGDVDRIAGCERLAARAVTGYDLARVDADAHLDSDASLSLELVVQEDDRLAHPAAALTARKASSS